MAEYEFKCMECKKIVTLEIPMKDYDTKAKRYHVKDLVKNKKCGGLLIRHFSKASAPYMRTHNNKGGTK